jgi:thioredoxin-like negative regulator of GroEL
MTAVSDFNYKVALAEGLRHLQKGKLRQAEQQFRYLVSKFPHADGGYRGLARVQVETSDRAGALATLRDGAAVMARGGDRATAIELLREAVTLDPVDLAAHRRLASALALAGDAGAATGEYVRFARAEMEAGDPARARLEVSYALETLGDLPALRELAGTLDLPARVLRREPEPAIPGPQVVTQTAPAEAAPADQEEEHVGAPALDDRLAWLTGGRPPAQPSSAAAAQASALLSAATQLQRDSPVDPVALEERALALIAAHDRFAGPVAIQAAGALLADGKVNAASDLLLQLVASGIAVHDAQRALIDVARAMGRSDVAEERARLLGEVERLG